MAGNLSSEQATLLLLTLTPMVSAFFWKSEVITLMALHNSKEMTNYCEEDPDDSEWKLAMPKLVLKANLKR